MSTKPKTPKAVKEEKVKIPLLVYSGKLIDLNNLSKDDIRVEDIAHGLALTCRYNGQCKRFYSVAEHCTRLAKVILDETQDHRFALVALMHDASEAYCSDVVFHLKRQLPDFMKFEKYLTSEINKNLGLDEIFEKYYPMLETYDRRISFDEMYFLFGQIDPWFHDNNVLPLGWDALKLNEQDQMGWAPELAEKNFLGVYQFLLMGIRAQEEAAQKALDENNNQDEEESDQNG